METSKQILCAQFIQIWVENHLAKQIWDKGHFIWKLQAVLTNVIG